MKRYAGMIFILAAGLANAFADTVTLKTGEVLSGKILRETADAVVVEYRFSSTILEERAIPRSEILKIGRESPDSKAFKVIEKIEAPATALDAEVYNKLIHSQLEPFLKIYGYSVHTPEVRAKIEAFEKEKKRLTEGELKIEGRWVREADAAAESYQLDARRAYGVMIHQVQAANLVGALNQFADLESRWPLAAVYPDAVESTRENLLKLDQLLTHQIRIFPFQEELRRLTVERAPVEQRPAIEAAQKRELEAAAAAVADSKKPEIRFAYYSPLIKTSMDELQGAVRAEYKRLSKIDLKPLREAVAEARQAVGQIEQKQLALAESSLKNAEAAWPKLESLPRLKAWLEQVRADALAGSEAQAKAVENAADLKKKEAKSAKP